MKGAYDDIIDLPHHVSQTRARMSAADRAAQFSSFAALSGYDEAIRETARQTERRIELDESEKAALSDALLRLARDIKRRPPVTVTYFRQDGRKAGGAYIRETGEAVAVDEYNSQLRLSSGAKIPFEDITALEV